MKKRLLAGLLSLCMIFGLLPVSAIAANPLEDGDTTNSVEQTSVEVKYTDTQRSKATITYHKKGIAANPFNVIFLVDTSRQGQNSHQAFEKMMRDNGMSYIYDYDAASTVQLIDYQQSIMENTGILDTKADLTSSFGQHGVSGEGTANEPLALQTAARAVKAAHDANDYPTVVFWVLGKEFGSTDTTAIEENLKALDNELKDGTDALVTWQYADTPNELLSQYATQHTEAHGDPNQKAPAAHAANDMTLMQEEMAADLEEIVHDHYHNIKFSLELDNNQTLVKKITGVRYEASSSMASLTTTLRDDGKGLDVTIERQCRQIDLDFILDVELDTSVYEKQTVIPAGKIIASHNGDNGGLHTGLFDEQIEYGLELDLPAVEMDRTAHNITFQNADGVSNITNKLTGESVTLPMGDELTQDGSSFGGWNVVSGANRGYHYAPGEIISMPSGDMTLEPAFGHVEVDLEIDYEQGDEPNVGNQMLQSNFSNDNPLDFYGVTLSNADGGGTIGEDSIVSVSVIDFLPEYDIIEQDQTTDSMQVKLTNVEDAVYARHIGASESDKVVAYLKPSSTHASKYDMVIAGPGGVKAPANCSYLFSNNSYHNKSCDFAFISLDALDTSGVTSMNNMFTSCNDVTNMDLSSWDTSSVKDMSYMFSYCTSLTNLNLGSFDTSSAIMMGSMFYNCSKLGRLDVSDWNTSKVMDMSSMFALCSSLTELNVTQWNTSSVTNMSSLFSGCSSLTGLDLSSWDTSKVTKMTSMFSGCNLTNMTSINGLDTSSVTNMSSMFQGSNLTGLDLSSWNVSNVTNMKQMFSNCSSETSLDLSGWNATNVTDMSGMFQGCKLTSLDLSSWNAPKVSNMANMFRECPNLTTLNLSGFQASGITNMNRMFYESSKLTSLDMDGFDTSLVTDMGYLFDGCTGLTSVQLSNWDTSKVLKMDWTFGDCSSLTSLDLSGWDTSSVTTMHQMFTRCSSLPSITFGANWSASSVTTMYSMFQGCSSLTSLDLSSFNTANVTDMSQMFSGCSQLTTLNLGENFTISKVSAMRAMFDSCSNLQTITGIKLDETNVATTFYNNRGLFEGLRNLTSVTFITSKSGAQFPNLSSMQNMFKNCSSLTSVDLGNWILPNLTNTSAMFSGCSSLTNINLSWSGIRATQNNYSITDMFNGVTTNASLESGSDNSLMLQAIRGAFPGTVTQNGQTLTQTNELITDPNAAPTLPEQAPSVSEPIPEETPDVADPTPEETPSISEPTPEEAPSVAEPTPEETPSVAEPTPEETPDDEPQTPANDTSEAVSQPQDENQSTSVEQTTQPAEEFEVVPLSTTAPALAQAVPTAEENESVHVHPDMVSADDKITYKVTVKYVGDVGVKSGRITLNFPIPEDIQQFQGDKDDPDHTNADWYVSTTGIKDSGAPTGYKGGRVVEEPKVVEVGGTGSGQYALQGVFEGLYTGTEVTVSIMTTVQGKDDNDYVNNYAFWDGTAYATDNAGTSASRTVRLWNLKDGGDNPTPPTTSYQLSYAFTGDVPSDAALPATTVVDSGTSIKAAAKPNTTLQGYTFDGWYRSDTNQKVTPDSSFNMPSSNLTLTGKWTLDDAYAQKITVKYEYTTNNDAQHIPDGAPLLPENQQVKVGQTHYIQKIDQDASYHKFGGWVPTLSVDGQEVKLTKQSDGTYQDDSKTYVIDIANGTLSTDQFRDKGTVVVTFSGAWTPYTGTIHFDANGGTGNMGDMENVAWDTTATLSPNTFTYPDADYQFVGWAKTPSGAVIKGDQAKANGLIDQDGETVTLYAVWKRGSYGVGYNLNHVTSSNTDTIVSLGGSYSTTLTSDSGYQMSDVSITMGGVVITGQVYDASTGAVSINNVNGNIIIKATATQKDGGSGGGGGGGSVTNKYPVHVDDTGNGTATSDKQEAAPGEVVTVNTNGTVDKITVTDKDGNEVPITDNSDGSFTFEMPNSEVTVKVEFEPLPEVADPNDTGVADWLDTVNHNSYLNGYPDSTFRPSGNMTRAEVAQMFYNLLLNKDVAVTVSFSDVKAGSWYETAVNTLASLGIVTGVSKNQFVPERAITRAEFTAIAMRFAKLDQTGTNIFSDVKQSDWFYKYVVGSIQYGWITGYSDGTFRPNNTITRAEVTTITNRMLGRAADETYVGNNSSSLRSFADVNRSHWAYYQIVEATNSHAFEKTDGAETWSNLK